MVGQWNHDKMWSLEGSTFFEPLQASLLDAQDCPCKAQAGRTAEANRSQRLCTLKVRHFVMLSTKDLPMKYENHVPSRQNLQHSWAGHHKIIKFCEPNTVELELPADMIIHNTIIVSKLKK